MPLRTRRLLLASDESRSHVADLRDRARAAEPLAERRDRHQAQHEHEEPQAITSHKIHYVNFSSNSTAARQLPTGII